MSADMHVRSDLQLRWSLYPLKALRAQTPHTASQWEREANRPRSENIGASCTGGPLDGRCAQWVYVEISLPWSSVKKRRVRALNPPRSPLLQVSYADVSRPPRCTFGHRFEPRRGPKTC